MKFSDCFKLIWHLHQSTACKLDLAFLRIEVHQLRKIHKLKIVEFSFRNAIIEFVHGVPRTITHAHHDNGERILGSLNNRIDGLSFIVNLTISDNQ
eukprot:TRINITY_DN3609_c0_g1_i2.p1 TRINITY_DN3609_c0_g1~~TRINITY_DN3609_c0_g1_i2.p1  ORF type:complete len:111 (+),score=0.02 TRINITY_DN3609_c0_g1_i2:46-333(+)